MSKEPTWWQRLTGHRFGADNFSIAQRQLLARLTVQPLDDYLKRVWEPYVGSLERLVRRFVAEGLLEDATLAEKVGARGLGELQTLAKQYGLKSSGTKAELGQRLAPVLPPAVASQMTAHLRLYRPTPAGQAIIDEYQRKEHAAYATMEAQALDALIRGDVHRAEAAALAFQTTYRYVVRVTGISTEVHDQSTYLLAHPQPDLAVDAGARRAVAARLVLSLLLGEQGRASKRLLDATGGSFACPAINEYLRHNPYRKGAQGDSEVEQSTPRMVADIYAHTLYGEASSVVTLRQLQAAHVGHGIQIIVFKDDGCSVCGHGKQHYRWAELVELPHLPRHWGCRCSYSPWV